MELPFLDAFERGAWQVSSALTAIAVSAGYAHPCFSCSTDFTLGSRLYITRVLWYMLSLVHRMEDNRADGLRLT